jgi:hypothetical protein
VTLPCLSAGDRAAADPDSESVVAVDERNLDVEPVGKPQPKFRVGGLATPRRPQRAGNRGLHRLANDAPAEQAHRPPSGHRRPGRSRFQFAACITGPSHNDQIYVLSLMSTQGRPADHNGGS